MSKPSLEILHNNLASGIVSAIWLADEVQNERNKLVEGGRDPATVAFAFDQYSVSTIEHICQGYLAMWMCLVEGPTLSIEHIKDYLENHINEMPLDAQVEFRDCYKTLQDQHKEATRATRKKT